MEDFCDFKEMSNCVRNFGVDEDGNTVKWTKICSMEFTKKETDTMHFRYLYDQDPPKKCLKLMKRARHTRQSIQSMPLRQLRSTYIPLSVAKFNDLRKLCDKELIPQHHHGFFRGLPHKENVWTTKAELRTTLFGCSQHRKLFSAKTVWTFCRKVHRHIVGFYVTNIEHFWKLSLRLGMIVFISYVCVRVCLWYQAEWF